MARRSEIWQGQTGGGGSGRPVYSVSQVNRHIKTLLDRDTQLNGIFVRGEVSGYKVYPSGYHYFSLKDAEGVLHCVIFSREAATIRFRPENGMQVTAFGRVAAYPRDGIYQLYVSALSPEGVGSLQAAFQALYDRLQAEGLFDDAHKKHLPEFPHRIALVTSPAGAALRDMLRILGDRWPMAEVCVVPCRVEGEGAAEEVAAAIAWANAHNVADVIITGRGGGAMEKLWTFNDEGVARAIYASRIPVISAVGHEPDFTIADYVADVRAATPTDGAKRAVADQNEQYDRIRHLSRRLAKTMEGQLSEARRLLDRAGRSRMLQDPFTWVGDRRQQLDRQQDRLARGLSDTLAASRERFSGMSAGLERGMTASLGAAKEDFARMSAKLDAMSPLKVLGRGYSIARGPKGVVRSVADVKEDDVLTLKVSDGDISCLVKGE